MHALAAFFGLIQAWLLALHFGWQASGVFWSVFFSKTTVGIWLFTKGKWKTVEV